MRKSLWLAGLSSLLAVGCSKDPRLGPPLPPCTARGDTVNLALGAYAAVDPGPIDGCTVFPGNLTGSPVEYLLVPQSASAKPNDSQSFKLQAASLALAGIALDLVAPEDPLAEPSPAERFHETLRLSERNLSARAPARVGLDARLQTAACAAPVTQGAVCSFKVCAVLECDVQKPTTLTTVTATAKTVGQHIAIFVDNEAPLPPNGLTQADLDALRAVFDTQLYAVDTMAFGRESDIDENGLVIVLMTNKVNQLVTAADCNKSGFVAGYFFGADLVTSGGTGNNGEIFYSLVADPTGGLSCAHSVQQVTQLVPVTFAHEFQHMISFNEHFIVRSASSEELWLNEALSHYAEERAGRSFLPDSATFCRFVFGDLSNAWKYDSAPQNHFLVDTSGIGGLANRGAYWLFLRYLIDQYADPSSPSPPSLTVADAYTKSLVRTTATGVTNVVQRASNTPFATLVSRWALANWVSDLPGFTAPPELRYKTWAFRSVYRTPSPCASVKTSFPLLPAVGAGSAVSLSGVLRAGSGMYHRATQGAGTPGFTLLFSDETGRALRTSLAPQLNVIRIQ